MIKNFINVLIFRVRPCACFMKGMMKRPEEYIASSSDQLSRIRSSDCTRTHLRGPRIPKKFGGGGACPQTPLDGVCVSVLYSRYLAPPPPPPPPPPNNSVATAGKSPITLVPYIGSTCSLNFSRHQIIGENKEVSFHWGTRG